MILRYINSLGISDDVVRNEIIRILQELPGVKDLALATPSSNVVVLDDQLMRTTVNNITVT